MNIPPRFSVSAGLTWIGRFIWKETKKKQFFSFWYYINKKTKQNVASKKSNLCCSQLEWQKSQTSHSFTLVGGIHFVDSIAISGLASFIQSLCEFTKNEKNEFDKVK